MKTPDSQQLVCAINEQPQVQSRNMDSHAKLAWFAVICLGLIALARCVPVEVVYTGEGCDCPSKLDYLVNVPKVPKPKKYAPAEYGYRVDVPVPVQAKAKVSYTFDFTVEEPRAPKPPKPAPKWNLYAKVDRVAVNKGDCEDSYAAPSAPAPCQCSQCGISQPPYRYVYKKVAPCKCQRQGCKCNIGRSYAYSPNAILPAREFRPATVVLPQSLDPVEPLESGAGNNIRRKRDLHRAFFRPRKSQKERPGRFVKLYYKNLPEGKQSLFGLDGLANPNSTPMKPKRKKGLFAHPRSRIVKRDIKGEYELIEKEREQMDLTLPEIIQFMPETLQPDFKRGQCYFGCSNQRNTPQPAQQSSTEFSSSSETSAVNSAAFSTDTHNYSDHKSRNNNENNNENTDEPTAEDTDAPRPPQQQKQQPQRQQQQRFLKETRASPQNVVSSSYTKRNAANYNHNAPNAKWPPFASNKKRAYRAQSPAHISTNPLYGGAAPALPPPPPGSAYSARSPQQPASAPRYVYDHMGRKYLESNGRLSLTVTSTTIADPTDRSGAPLQYAGDLEAPPAGYSELLDDDAIVSAPNYPVQHISNEQLDRIISEIIYRHPEFIDASSHYHGALVDPEPWQEQETKEFLKKLIDGRLNLWFGLEDDYIPHYSNPFNEYNAPPMFSYLPPLH